MYNEELYIELENRMFLKKLDNKDLLHPNFRNLISQKIFEECEPFDLRKLGKCTLPHNIEIEKDSITFDTNIFFDSKTYEINKAILREIYISIKFLVEEVTFDSVWDLNEIEINLIARISKTEKIKYLDDLHKDLFLEIQKEPEYFIFTGEKEFQGYDSWEKLILDYLQDEVLLIEKYLTIDFQINDIPKELFNDWLKYLRVKYLTDFCLSKRAEIKNQKKDKKPYDLLPNKEELTIFKNNGLAVFNCIISNYQDKKNKAFFSYLFHFMISKELLRTNAKTNSKKYVDYISKNHKVKMSKVINSQANEQTEFKLKMTHFEDILKMNKI